MGLLMFAAMMLIIYSITIPIAFFEHPETDDYPDPIKSKFEKLIPIVLGAFSLVMSVFYFFNLLSVMSIFNPLIIATLISLILPYFLVKYDNLKVSFTDGLFYASIFPFFTLPYILFLDFQDWKFTIVFIIMVSFCVLILLLGVFSIIAKHSLLREQIFLKSVYLLAVLIMFGIINNELSNYFSIPFCYMLIIFASASLTNILYNRKQNKNEDMVNEQTSTAGEIKD